MRSKTSSGSPALPSNVGSRVHKSPRTRRGELLRIPLPRTPVNTALADVPGLAGWHHSWPRPLAERELAPMEEEATTVSAEVNLALVRRLFEARAKADLDAIDEILAPTSWYTPSCFPTNAPTCPTAKPISALSPSTLPPSPTSASLSKTR